MNKPRVFGSRRSQVFSSDLYVSLFLFISFTLISIFLFNYTATLIDDYITTREIDRLAQISTSLLIRSPGVPEEWNRTDFVALGLASQDNVLNASKLIELNYTAYEDAKEVLSIGGYEFYINITDFHDNVILLYGNTSKDLANKLYAIRRLCLYDNGTRSLSYLKMVVWT